MRKKALIILALVVCLSLVSAGGSVVADEVQTESVRLEWKRSSNLFTALGQLEKVKLEVYDLPRSMRSNARCMIFERQASHAKAALVKYFDGKQLTPQGKQRWEDFPWSGAAYVLAERYDMTTSESAWSYIWSNIFLAEQGKDFCKIGRQLDMLIEFGGN